ncbi:MAG: C4-dicarboxylate TRAP transporter substrate-binding protein [Rhodospirillaceae bacterium]|jgi:TRAP-type transport system periplasmic protein|nr:C4-dicarboxylate TRAP transporter substrate-binding protein [Rhodospirillaceae bacterium]MBT5083229.1 C4-dicarboxylate TRAP transporter substrate-binding protein [Rhodospirillaceae bacterium]MBT5523450.1 C4-dicarboxylate TRAP transporter substrate-binding protein [Rhodospirillaceae bacterium]MBT5878557.1 C4-dicarboxylate TRAP transporter substrate-binding protein [Rhodospirillaceae bacterium]MBT6591722.1 C4-dicarboxylate TRAP transporter substrate-binding protein [Rhodospirillaceae bacterium
MKRLTIFRAAIAATVLSMVAGTAMVTDASAKTLKSAVGLATSSAQFYAHQRFADYVKEHSDLKIKVFSMSLLNLKETPPGVRDGIADMGFVLPPYYPAEYAENNLPANLSMLSTTGRQVESPGAAMAGATSEYTYFHCPECLAEYKKQNQIYLGTGASPTYINLCTTPLRSLEDLKGKKYRSGAANFGRWAEHFGGIKVSIPGNDIYEAMDQGVIDCAMLSATELTNLSLFDLTKFVVRRIPGGVFSGVATINVNRDSWQDLTTAERKVFLQGAARINADLTWKYYSDAKKNIDASPAKGIEVIEPGPEIMKASGEFVKGDVKIIAAQFTKDYGLKNVDPKIAKITELIEKWKGLTADIADDPEALTKLYWDEIFSKIDPATFGMK